MSVPTSKNEGNCPLYHFIQTKYVSLHASKTQHTHMHANDTTVTPSGHQMAVVAYNRGIEY